MTPYYCKEKGNRHVMDINKRPLQCKGKMGVGEGQ